MLLVSNQNRISHLTSIKKSLVKADEIIICVAFLKMSGLNSLRAALSSKIGKCTFYVGTDYYLTEPDAIRELFQQGHTVLIFKKNSSTFHPKVYYFRTKNDISILVGSANLTGGGLETNSEISAFFETTKGSKEDKQFRAIVEQYSHNSTEVNELEISQYERKYLIYKSKQKKAKQEFDEEVKQIHELDLSKLVKYLKEYISGGGNERFQNRIKNYKNAKVLLNNLSNAQIRSASEFLEYYDEIAKSYYSSGLLRGKKTFARKYRIILKIINLVKENKRAKPSVLFGKVLPLVHSVKKFGINGLTELMNTYNPKEFSVANGRTIESIADIGYKKFPQANNFTTETYNEYNNLIIAMAKKCHFDNLGQVDHFLSYYYAKHVKRKKGAELKKQL